MKEFRHLLFMETGGHNWKKVKSKYKFTDPKGNEYVVEKCTQCGITGQRYIFQDRDKKEKALKSIYIGPQYLRKYVIKCPKEMGLFDYIDPEKEETVAVLGGGSGNNFYTGNIKPKKNTVFVFGSNPEGRHGAGAAKIARNQFGAIFGQGEGLQGSAYALPTKDLRVKENKGFKSISFNQIVSNIKNLYNTARQNPDKKFKIAYRNTIEHSLNGYTGLEIIAMFNKATIESLEGLPNNIIFSKEWFNTNKLTGITKKEKKKKGKKDKKGKKAKRFIRIKNIKSLSKSKKIKKIKRIRKKY